MTPTSKLNRIIRSAAVLLSGAAGGQVLVVAVAPLLTRLYGPAEFGVLGTFAATLYFVSSIAALRFDAAIPIAKTEQDAIALRRLALLCVAGTSLICAAAIQLLSLWVPSRTLHLFSWALPFAVLALGSYSVAMYWRLRLGDHVLIAKTRVLQAISSITVQLAFGIFGNGAIGLVLGQILGLSAGVSRLTPFSRISRWDAFWLPEVKRAFKVYERFATFNAPATLLSIVNTHAATVLIAIIGSPAAAGAYALVQRIFATPFALISSALSGALFSHARTMQRRDTEIFARRFLDLTVVVSPLLTIGALLSNASFRQIFGAEWAATGPIAAWVILFLGQKFIFDSIFATFTTTARQATGMALQAAVFVVRSSVLVAAILNVNIENALFAFSIVSAASYFFAALIGLERSVMSSFGGTLARAIDCVFPYVVVYAGLHNLAFVTVCVVYVLWVGVRLWRFAVPVIWPVERPLEALNE